MLDRFINAILNKRKIVVIVFVVVALVCAAMIPFVSTNYNMVDYLPPSAQSTEAVTIMEDEFSQDTPNANVLVRDVDIPSALAMKDEIAALDGIDSVMWLDDVVDMTVPLETLDQDTVETYYRNGDALFQVAVAEGTEQQTVENLRDMIDAVGEGNAVSGDAADLEQMQSSLTNQIILALSIIIPIILLLLILATQSWIEPVLFIAAIGVSILINMGTNIVLGEVSFITSSVSPILQLAVSLDYAIFLLHAFTAERKLTSDPVQAMARATRSSMKTIAASALTTMFGFGALACMQFQIGADLGINLVKGIIFSFITVMIFLPALTVMLYKLIDKTTHRPFMPSFKNVNKVLSKVRIPALILVIVLFVPAFLGQTHTVFTYQNGTPDITQRTGADTETITNEFGQQNIIVVLVPRGDVAADAALSEELKSINHVTSVMSYVNTVGATIPEEYLDPSVVEQFYSDNYARIIAYVDTDVEGDVAFDTVEAIQQATADHYDTYYTAGQPANLYDMKNIVSVDNVRVTLVAIIAIFLVIMLVFRSIALPLVLLLTIETGIWINLAIPYFTGVEVNFIGYLVINTVQLGATIDYGILLTTHYLDHRHRLPAREAIGKALAETVPSLIVSAAILATAGFALAASSSMSSVNSLGLLLGRGAILSFVLVTCFLPALLVYLDGFIRRTTWRANFAPQEVAQNSHQNDASLSATIQEECSSKRSTVKTQTATDSFDLPPDEGDIS